MKYLLAAAIVFVVSGGAALAQRQEGGGRCPVGTCAKNGSDFARNLANCKKSNCARATPAPRR
jgi:hypothetical protein